MRNTFKLREPGGVYVLENEAIHIDNEDEENCIRSAIANMTVA